MFYAKDTNPHTHSLHSMPSRLCSPRHCNTQPFSWIKVFAMLSVAAIFEEEELIDSNHLPCLFCKACAEACHCYVPQSDRGQPLVPTVLHV